MADDMTTYYPGLQPPFTKIRFEGTHIFSAAQFRNGHTIVLQDCEFNSLTISGFTFLRMANCVGKDLTMHECKQGTLRVIKADSIVYDYFDALTIEDCTIGKEIKVTNVLQCTISLSTIAKCTISRFEKGNVSFRDVKFDELIFSHANTVDARLEFNDIKVVQQLRVFDSVLDSTIFNRFNLENAKLFFQRSSIETAKYFSVRWMTSFKVEVNNNGTSDDDKLSALWDLREAYRQLKVVCIDSHNKLDALNFQKEELRTHYDEVTARLFTKGQGSIFDWLVLFTNRIFSNYGRSWVLPLTWLLVIHFMFFSYYFMSDLGISVSFIGGWDGHIIRKAFGYYFNLLSPVHDSSIKSINGKEVNIYGAADFFMRISSAYFIYYFVRGTRKYNFSI